jgi:hypothetical protein
MNERIKQLARQAGLIAPYGSDREGLSDFDYREFAELIVRECLTIAKNREDEFESAGLLDESNAVGNVAYRISRQFGVK